MDASRQPRRDLDGIVADLTVTLDPAVQARLKQELQLHPERLEAATYAALRFNPFLELSPHEISELETRRRCAAAEKDMLLLRQLAARLDGRRIAVFAMPKSGSTFVQTAIHHAARLPLVSLTSVGGGSASSRFGMNGREQELDEFAMVTQSFRGHGSWVAQHHTRFTPYLGAQLRFYRITPVLTVRNIFDAIVSMDDMLLGWSRDWRMSPPYALPLDYQDLEREERLELLAGDLGIWLIKFLISWKRGIAAGLVDPLILSYERDMLDPATLETRLVDPLRLNHSEHAALSAYLKAPPDEQTRFNKGVVGRGAAVPREARLMLERYARRFHVDLGNDGMAYLFGDAC